MTNFDYLKKDPKFKSFSEVAISSEKLLPIDREACVTDYVERAGIEEFEYIREELRGLMKYISRDKVKYDTNFADDILSTE